jgi:hypothetical protein
LKHLFTTLAAMLAMLSSVWGNGGTFSTSDVTATGQLAPERKPRVQLIAEDLDIVMRRDSAEVSVVYHLDNRGRGETVKFGFPVDGFSGSAPDAQRGVSNYQIALDGNSLEVGKVVNVSTDTEQVYALPGGGKSVRHWFFSHVPLPDKSTAKLRVSYSVALYGTETGTSKDFLWRYSKSLFSYTFKPAATWGNGKIGRLRIRVNVATIKDDSYSFSLDGWRREGDWLILDLQNIAVAKLPDLVVTVDGRTSRDHEKVWGNRLPRKLITSIRSSSTLAPTAKASYQVEHLLDGKPDTAWIEGAKSTGKNEWIELEVAPNVNVWGIGLLNGYTKSPEHFTENGRPTKVQIQVWTPDKQLRRSPDFGPAFQAQIRELQPRQWSTALQRFPGGCTDWLWSGEGPAPVNKIRITILDASPGSKDLDTAISELVIYGGRGMRGG